jgi:hypothetical protein
VRRRQVEPEAVAAVCRGIGLGRTTQTRLLRTLGE